MPVVRLRMEAKNREPQEVPEVRALATWMGGEEGMIDDESGTRHFSTEGFAEFALQTFLTSLVFFVLEAVWIQGFRLPVTPIALAVYISIAVIPAIILEYSFFGCEIWDDCPDYYD